LKTLKPQLKAFITFIGSKRGHGIGIKHHKTQGRGFLHKFLEDFHLTSKKEKGAGEWYLRELPLGKVYWYERVPQEEIIMKIIDQTREVWGLNRLEEIWRSPCEEAKPR